MRQEKPTSPQRCDLQYQVRPTFPVGRQCEVAAEVGSRQERLQRFRLQEDGMTVEKLTACFLRSPLYTTAYDNGFGTIYTAAYKPQSRN